MYLAQACAPIYANNEAQWESFEAGHGQAASPQFSMPAGLKSIDPAWSACKPFPLGVWDPPRTLSSVSAMDPTTQHISTTTPAASPGVSPTPLITPTVSHADPTSTNSHDPKNTADLKQTVDPASSKTQDSLFHSEAAGQADSAIDQSLGLRPSRTQNPNSHSDQGDPDPSASPSTYTSPKMTSIGDPSGTAAISRSGTDDAQHLTSTNGKAPSAIDTALAVPVDLPVIDPMTLIGPQAGSSHSTSASITEANSKNDAASKTRVADTKSTTDPAVEAHDTGIGNAINPAIMSKDIGVDNVFGAAAGASSRKTDAASKPHGPNTKSTTDSAVEAHDTGVGNVIDPAVMSKAIGIDNMFGVAAEPSSKESGGGVDPASKSTSADINIPDATKGAHTTDISSQVDFASTRRSADFGNDFNPQETARPFTAATIGAQVSKPSESAGKTGLYESVDGGFENTIHGTTVHETTVPGTTREGTTIPSTTILGTTIPGTTIRGTTIHGTMIQATQSGQYEPGSTTRGLSIASSGTDASNPSILNGLGSSTGDNSDGSPAKSETARSGSSNNIMSTMNSHDGFISEPTGNSGAELTSSVGIGPQSDELTNSQTRPTARLTSRASTTNPADSTASNPAPFLGQGTRLLPNSAFLAFVWLVSSASWINSWMW